MTIRLCPIALLLISLLFVSATSVQLESYPITKKGIVTRESNIESQRVKKSEPGFVDRLLLKYVLKKIRRAENQTKADRQASTSLSFGIASMGFLLLGLFIPYVIFATIPLAIVAMVTGSSALKDGTTEKGKARTGKTLGLASLITFGVFLIVALIVVASFLGSWGG